MGKASRLSERDAIAQWKKAVDSNMPYIAERQKAKVTVFASFFGIYSHGCYTLLSAVVGQFFQNYFYPMTDSCGKM